MNSVKSGEVYLMVDEFQGETLGAGMSVRTSTGDLEH